MIGLTFVFVVIVRMQKQGTLYFVTINADLYMAPVQDVTMWCPIKLTPCIPFKMCTGQ